MIRGGVLLDDAPDLGQIERAEWRPVVFTMPWNGAGSKWSDLAHWTWGAPVDALIREAERADE